MVPLTAIDATTAAFGSVIGPAAFEPLQLTGNFLWLAIVFFALALVAALVGFRGVAGVSMDIARIFILVFVVLAVIALVM